MKKLLVLTVLLTLSLGAAAAIVGSEHDLSTTGASAANRSTNVSEVCGFCHIPHNSNNATLPLWNHTASTQTFSPYVSPTGTLNATVGQPGAGSLQCLGCHDGVTGLGSVVTLGGQLYGAGNALVTPSNSATGMTGGGLLGTDLSNDHPVGFTYNAALATADGQLADPTLPATIAPARLIGGRVECSSCHSMHRPLVTANILIDNMTGSALCLDCHVK